MSTLMRDLVLENPMFTHTARRGKKYVRLCTKIVGYVRVGITALAYFLVLAFYMLTSSKWEVQLLIFEVIALSLVIPICTYSSIAGEREKATWDALVLTRLTTRQIVTGQVLWRIVIASIVVGLFAIPIAFVPMMQLNPYYSWSSWITDQAVAFSWGVLLCAFGIYVSAKCARSSTAATVIGATVFCAVAMIPLLGRFLLFAPNSGETELLLLLNPIHVLAPGTFEQVLFTGTNFYRGDNSMDNGVLGYLAPILIYLVASATFLWATFVSLRRQEEAAWAGS